MNIFKSIKQTRYRFKNRRQLYEDSQKSVSGFSISSGSLTYAHDSLRLRSLLNALLMFAVVYGLALSFIIPFEINANIGFIAVIYLILSLYFAFINNRPGIQALGYIIFFIAFTAFLIIFRSFINSGLNGMLNDFYAIISDKLDFSQIKTYDESFPEQHYMTVSVFFMVIGAAYLMLVNFTFNNEQSPLTILVLIFPFLQFAMYVDEFSGMPSFFLVVLAITSCLMLRYNFQHRLPTKKRNTFYFRRKKDIYHLQSSSGLVTLQTTGFIAGILLIFCLVISVLFPSSSFSPGKESLALKEETKPAVTKVLMYGLASLLRNGQTEWDSSMGGQLGNVGTVYQDFENDISVTFTPYQYDFTYLRANVFSGYRSNSWRPDAVVPELFPVSNMTLSKNAATALASEDTSVLTGRMEIELLDYSLIGTRFLPYYGQMLLGSNSAPLVSASSQRLYELEYVAFQDFWNSSYSDLAVYEGLTEQENLYITSYLSMYDELDLLTSPDSYDYYSSLLSALDNVIREQNFHGSTAEIISQIQKYLEENFTYTLNPGKLPAGRDFVDYFLSDSKKGYCTYFATTGCMLLRRLGIPARYCEGYAISMSSVVGGDILTDEDYEDWITGTSSIGKTAVVKANITDAQAHAWCEVYVPSIGWVPVEFTVSGTMDESDKDSWNIWDQFTSGSDNTNANNILAGIFSLDIGSVFLWIGRLIIAAFIILLPLIAFRFYKKTKDKKDPNAIIYPVNNKKLMKEYEKLVKYLFKKGYISDINLTASAIREVLVSLTAKETTDLIIRLYQKAAYSPFEISDSELSEWKKAVNKINHL